MIIVNLACTDILTWGFLEINVSFAVTPGGMRDDPAEDGAVHSELHFLRLSHSLRQQINTP